MPIEVEQKFAVDDHREIQARLLQLGRIKLTVSSKLIDISTIPRATSPKPMKHYACAAWAKRISSRIKAPSSTPPRKRAAKSNCRWQGELERRPVCRIAGCTRLPAFRRGA